MEIEFKSENEVLEYNLEDKENNQVIIYQGKVYNVHEYKEQHPGGVELLDKLLGKNIEEEFEEAEHTKSARNIFKDLPLVGTMANTKSEKFDTSYFGIHNLHEIDEKKSDQFDFDYDNKPLVHQIF